MRDGLEADEQILVAVSAQKIDLLRSALGQASGVRFVDMPKMGLNPARIIPVWREFVSASAEAGTQCRGVGEPVWPERTTAEVIECERHEALLNVAFAEGPSWHLLCPYDTTTLDGAIVTSAKETHPTIRSDGVRTASTTFAGLRAFAEPFTDPLPEPEGEVRRWQFGRSDLAALRAHVRAAGGEVRLSTERQEDLILAVDEAATNSLRHGGGRGALRLWIEGQGLVCEILDEGMVGPPLAGRIRPTKGQGSGLGLWLANQVCDLVQIRQMPEGSVVRLHMRSDPSALSARATDR